MTTTPADTKLFEWACNRNIGSFSFHLFEAISKADLENREKFKLAFPQETEAMNRYNNESGYWESLVNELS
jgi:hypothetical protein